MDTYKIEKAYPWTTENEITIKSENLFYSELNLKQNGCQSANSENNKEIRNKCFKIAELIREIEILNYVQKII